MRSKELADLAGVTVRTLRHYHQMGLLPEPPRAENGYRTYGAVDLARVLRIKRLASLGVSLQQVKDMFDAEHADSAPDSSKSQAQSADEALAALDEELARQIEHLQGQRRVIAELRNRAIDPDVPPAFGDHVVRLRGAGASDELVEYERSGLLLVDRFFDEESEETEAVSQFFGLIAETKSVDSYVDFSECMLALAPDASEEECAKLAEDFVSFMVPILKLGCRQYGWDLSPEKIEALACSPDLPFSSLGHGEGVCAEGGCGEARRAVASVRKEPTAPADAEEAQALDLLLDLYDSETLNDAQRRMNELVVEGIMSELMKG